MWVATLTDVTISLRHKTLDCTVPRVSSRTSSCVGVYGPFAWSATDGACITVSPADFAHKNHYRTSLAFGHPYMIDVEDCDARLPSSEDPVDLYITELVRLSVILGRVSKAIYR